MSLLSCAGVKHGPSIPKPPGTGHMTGAGHGKGHLCPCVSPWTSCMKREAHVAMCEEDCFFGTPAVTKSGVMLA